MKVILKPRPTGSTYDEYLTFTQERQRKAESIADRLIRQIAELNELRSQINTEIFTQRDRLSDEVYDGKRTWLSVDDDATLLDLYGAKNKTAKRIADVNKRLSLVIDTGIAYANRVFRELD